MSRLPDDSSASPVTVERPGWLAPVEWAAMTAASALWLVLAARLVGTETTSFRFWWLGVGVALGYLAADFFSGLVHWFCDTFFEEDTPLIGRMLIEPFREHHRDPLAMTRHGLAEIAGNSCLAIAPLLAAVAFLAPPATGAPLSLAAHSALLTFAVGAVITNQFHKWAHLPAAPRMVASLQQAGLVLRPAHHAGHHRTQAEAYCVATGWMNPFLDRIGFFPAAEGALSALGLPMSVTAPRRRDGQRRDGPPLPRNGPPPRGNG
jgi:ubiquitin-conjugating enzyme E2 variant